MSKRTETELKVGDAPAAPAAPSVLSAAKISSLSVHSMPTYDLRQELVRRNCLDIPEDDINHNSLLQRLIVELVKDESNEVQKRTADVLEKAQVDRDVAKELREQKKAEALARSKARQADAQYFATKQAANVRPEKTITVAAEEGVEKEHEEDDSTAIADPFRVNAGKSRAKISGFF
jgi:hypothetical protein